MIKAPMSLWRHAEALYQAPLEMEYQGLDPATQYRLKVVYAGETLGAKIRIEAGGGLELHPFLAWLGPLHALEFDIPRDVSRSGELRLRWMKEPGAGGWGRGPQVAEAWLMRK